MSNISPLITPFRWYDKYHNQNRFDNDCNSFCDFELITDPRNMLPFQFKRLASPFLLTDWILRKCCTDPNKLMLDKVDSNFVSESMSWVDENEITGEQVPAWAANTCGGLCAITREDEYATTNLTWTGLTIGKTYSYSFLIKNFTDCGHLGIVVSISNGATLLSNYNSEGLKTGTFVATATTVVLSFSLVTVDCDVICIEYLQITEEFEVNVDEDIVFPEEAINYFNSEGNDYFVYCGGDHAITVPPGCYYSIIQDEGGNLYFSEVITVKEFIPEKSPYLLFEWWNTCDLKDVIYHDLDDCLYKNRLWLLDSVLSRPSYPFKEEGEEDGNQSFNSTFQKLDKTISLTAAKIPEFIIDALNGVRLHDTIQFTKPLRVLKQEVVDDPVPVISVECDTEFIFQDCYGKVELKCLLDEKYVDETCCTNITPPECVLCNAESAAVDVFDSDLYEYALIVTSGGSDEGTGLYQFIGGEWVLLDPDDILDILICPQGSGQVWQYQPENPNGVATGGFVLTPELLSVVYDSGNIFDVVGNLNNRSFGQIEYSTDGGTTWIPTTPKMTWEEIQTTFPVTFPGVPCCGIFLVRLHAFNLNGCDYGYSEEVEVDSPTDDCC